MLGAVTASCSVLFESVLDDNAVVDAAVDVEGGDGPTDDAEAGTSDGPVADAVPDVVYALPCTPGAPNTPLCDGFEGRSDPNGTNWLTTNEQGSAGSVVVIPSGGSGSMRFARFTSAANAAGNLRLVHDGALQGAVFWVSVDVRLGYDAASYTGTARRNILGVDALSGDAGGTPRGFAGISLTAAGVVAEANLQGGPRTANVLDDALAGAAWHRVELEVTFSTMTVGQVRVWVDNRPQPTIAARPTVTAAVDAFSVSIGASADGNRPALNAEYDNVSVHFGARP